MTSLRVMSRCVITYDASDGKPRTNRSFEKCHNSRTDPFVAARLRTETILTIRQIPAIRNSNNPCYRLTPPTILSLGTKFMTLTLQDYLSKCERDSRTTG